MDEDVLIWIKSRAGHIRNVVRKLQLPQLRTHNFVCGFAIVINRQNIVDFAVARFARFYAISLDRNTRRQQPGPAKILLSCGCGLCGLSDNSLARNKFAANIPTKYQSWAHPQCCPQTTTSAILRIDKFYCGLRSRYKK